MLGHKASSPRAPSVIYLIVTTLSIARKRTQSLSSQLFVNHVMNDTKRYFASMWYIFFCRQINLGTLKKLLGVWSIARYALNDQNIMTVEKFNFYLFLFFLLFSSFFIQCTQNANDDDINLTFLIFF